MYTGLVGGGNSAQSKGLSDVFRFDRDTLVVVEIRGEWCGFGRFVVAKMEEATDDSFGRTCQGSPLRPCVMTSLLVPFFCVVT
jgi:hypothetical protein